jgi:hypothetical protein
MQYAPWAAQLVVPSHSINCRLYVQPATPAQKPSAWFHALHAIEPPRHAAVIAHPADPSHVA